MIIGTKLYIIMVLTLLILVNTCAAIIEAYFDVIDVKSKQPIVHWKSNVIRVTFWVAAAMIYLWSQWLALVVFIFVLATNYWLVFDYAYNYFFGHGWGYNSETSNLQDRVLNYISKKNKWVKLFIKLAAFGLSLTIYLLLI